MKSSICIAATGAAVAMAGPIDLLKRVLITEVTTQYYTQTVYQDEPPVTVTVQGTKSFFQNGGKAYKTSSTTYVAPAPTTEVVIISTSTETPVASETPAASVPTNEAPVVAYTAESTTQATQKAAATTAAAAADAPNAMASAALNSHNLHRLNNSASEMTWNTEIAGYAEITAKKCVFAHDMDEGAKNYGQNIAMWGTSNNAANLGADGAMNMATTDMWYNGEINLFLDSYYGQDTPDMSTFEAWGHYSQLVWAGSKELGCHAQLCEKGSMFDDMDAWYMVCNYRPAGNVGGQYGANVKKPLGKATVTA